MFCEELHDVRLEQLTWNASMVSTHAMIQVNAFVNFSETHN